MKEGKFERGDWVIIKSGENAGMVGKVSMLEKDGFYGVVVYNEKDEPDSMVNLAAGVIDFLAPVTLTAGKLKDFVRCKTTYDDYKEKIYPAFNVKAAAVYALTAEDIRAALKKITKMNKPLEQFRQWFWIINNIFYDNLDIEGRYDSTFISIAPASDNEMFSVAFGMTERLYWSIEGRLTEKYSEEEYIIKFENEPDWNKSDPGKDIIEEYAFLSACDDIISRVNVYVRNKSLPESERVYSLSQKRYLVKRFEDETYMNKASEEELALVRRFLYELAYDGDINALQVMAWSFYEGNPIFAQDYILAEKYMLEIYNRAGDPYAANALGYIYYYGQAGGRRDYEKAFKFFSFGMAAYLDESIYKCGDMLIRGLGVPKNIDMGIGLIADGYKEAMYKFCEEKFDCKLADYALRMGNICRNKLAYGMDDRDAYKFYLEARFAVEKRIALGKNFKGDDHVRADVNRAIEEMQNEYGIDPGRKQLKADFPVFLNQIYDDKFPVKVDIHINKDGKTGYLKVERFRLENELVEKGIIPEDNDLDIEEIPKVLLAFPELSYAELTSGVTYKLEGVSLAQISDKSMGFFLSDGFRRNETTNALEFFAGGEMIAALEAKWYIINVKK